MRTQLQLKLGFLLLMVLLSSGNVWATVKGQCSNCHTMHNSQKGTLDTTLSGATIPSVNRSLTKGDCVGCHTGTIASSATDGIPYIMSSSGTEYGPDYNPSGGGLVNAGGTNTLAGGTFNYVRAAGSDTKGHNVFNIREAADSEMPDLTPPGWIASTFQADAGGGIATGHINGENATWSTQLTCAGTNGCHGSHNTADDFADISGGHHGDDTTIDGSTVAKSYRFLRGILGYEDADWELTVSDADHNTYYGVDRTTTATGSMNKKTISYLCAECHGLFHSNDGTTDGSGIIYDGEAIDNANPWLRHPTDFALKSTNANSEYLSYADAAGTEASAAGTTAVYNYIAPLASANVTTDADNNIKASTTTPPSGAISNPFSGTDNDIVTCLSCHRAHGSAYADLLRWDYTNIKAGSAAVVGFDNKGCFACHTTKD